MNIGTNQTGEPTHHGETKSKPLDLLMAGGDGTIELVEDFLAFRRRYAAPGIGERHQRVAVLPVGRKLYLSPPSSQYFVALEMRLPTMMPNALRSALMVSSLGATFIVMCKPLRMIWLE